MPNSYTSTERINLRLQSHAKSLIERAAQFKGKTLSSFILNCAIAEAEKTISEHEHINLSVKESEAFYDALCGPVKFNQNLLDALEEHDNTVDSL